MGYSHILYMFQAVILLQLFTGHIYGQHNLEKYWIYRERLKNFMVSGDCQGCNAVAEKRRPDNNIRWADSPWQLGYWIATLATEYHLLKNNGYTGANLTITKKQLFFAIEKINQCINIVR